MNVQQIPSDIEFRKCFTAPKGWKLVNCDYSAQENYITADKSKDANMLKLINDGGDSHCLVARYAFPELKDFTDDEIKKQRSDARSAAKAAGFACAYGGNGFTISKNLGLSEKEGEIVYEGYFKAYPDLAKYFDKVEAETLRNGYITINEISGRRRQLPMFDRYKRYMKIPSKRKEALKLQSKIRRLSMNSPTQGTAADQSKLAGIMFRKWINDNNYQDSIKLVLTLHDEWMALVTEELAELAAENLGRCMEEAGNKFVTTVKMKAEAVVADYWHH